MGNSKTSARSGERKKRLTAQQREQCRLRVAARRKRKIRRVIFRVVLSIFTVIAMLLITLLAAGALAFNGPSQSVGDLLTVSLLETSALKFVPRIYYNEEKMQDVIDRNSMVMTEEETDLSLIVIATPTPAPTLAPVREDELLGTTPAPETDNSVDGIEIEQVSGPTFNGYMMIIHDPSRVKVGTCRDGGFNSSAGKRLDEIAERYDAVAAINGGAFADANGQGNGGQPTGLVIANGKVLHRANSGTDWNVSVGFTKDNVLVVGKVSADKAIRKGVRDMLTFGPALVLNGKACSAKGAGSGLNPRAAIGQRADGAVLFLVIDGRQAHSIGATYSDMIRLFLEYGAVNACNLDGGSSALLYYKGKYLNSGVVATGSRRIPTAFVVVQ